LVDGLMKEVGQLIAIFYERHRQNIGAA